MNTSTTSEADISVTGYQAERAFLIQEITEGLLGVSRNLRAANRNLEGLVATGHTVENVAKLWGDFSNSVAHK
jgi:hypothetical protein